MAELPFGRASTPTQIPLAGAEPLLLWRCWDSEPINLDGESLGIEWLPQRQIQTPGGKFPTPRLEALYGDRDATYRYSGNTYTAAPWPPALDDLRNRVAATTGIRFDLMFANLYRNGHDSIGWHADDEEDALGPAADIMIASLSYGRRRPFNLKGRPGTAWKMDRASVELGEGDLLLMGRRTQSRYLHCLPKRPNHTAARLNLTFRRTR